MFKFLSKIFPLFPERVPQKINAGRCITTIVFKDGSERIIEHIGTAYYSIFDERIHLTSGTEMAEDWVNEEYECGNIYLTNNFDVIVPITDVVKILFKTENYEIEV